jgi:hypothetical protein
VERAPEPAVAAAREVLGRAASGEVAALEEVAAALADLRLFVPLRGADGGPAPPAALPEDRPTSWPALVGPSAADLALPAFTGPDTLATFRRRTRAVGIGFEEVLRLTAACGVGAVVVDPGSSHPVLLAARPTSGPAGQDGRGAAPPSWGRHHPVRALAGPLPEADLAVLREVLPTLPVERAWAVELVDPNALVHLVLAVEPTGDPTAVVAAVADALGTRLEHPDQVRVDVVALTDPDLHADVAALDEPLHPAPPRAAGRVTGARPVPPPR